MEEINEELTPGIHIDPSKYTKVPNTIFNNLQDASGKTFLTYLWLLDKITSAYDEDGVNIGIVMYGRSGVRSTKHRRIVEPVRRF
jgi:hypothetical protein